jgi:hypothetical protein
MQKNSTVFAPSCQQYHGGRRDHGGKQLQKILEPQIHAGERGVGKGGKQKEEFSDGEHGGHGERGNKKDIEPQPGVLILQHSQAPGQ